MTYAHFTTSEGTFTIQLFDEDAPKTVANFVGLAEGTKEWTDPRPGRKGAGGYYNGMIFHRVIARHRLAISGRQPALTQDSSPACQS